MTREQILNSVSLKKRFCKDYNLPITIYDNPYFYERLSAIDVMFDCIDKFDNFCRCLSNFESEQDYFEYFCAPKRQCPMQRGARTVKKQNKKTYNNLQ